MADNIIVYFDPDTVYTATNRRCDLITESEASAFVPDWASNSQIKVQTPAVALAFQKASVLSNRTFLHFAEQSNVYSNY